MVNLLSELALAGRKVNEAEAAAPVDLMARSAEAEAMVSSEVGFGEVVPMLTLPVEKYMSFPEVVHWLEPEGQEALQVPPRQMLEAEATLNEPVPMVCRSPDISKSLLVEM